MKEDKLRETIKALEEKLSQQEERYDRLKREYVNNAKVLRLNHGEYNEILEALRTRVTGIKAKRQQAADRGNEVQRKTYGHKEFRLNELIRKLRSAKVMDEATDNN